MAFHTRTHSCARGRTPTYTKKWQIDDKTNERELRAARVISDLSRRNSVLFLTAYHACLMLYRALNGCRLLADIFGAWDFINCKLSGTWKTPRFTVNFTRTSRPTLRIRRNDLSLMQFIYERLAEIAKREEYTLHGCIIFARSPL